MDRALDEEEVPAAERGVAGWKAAAGVAATARNARELNFIIYK